MLCWHTRGIFVTTSVYQPGAAEAAGKAGRKSLPIELVDGERFLHEPQIAQREHFAAHLGYPCLEDLKACTPYIVFEAHLNSL